METFTFTQFPSDVYIALFTEVTNGASIRKRIIDAAMAPGEEGEREREAVNFAFIDARFIISRLHLQTAIYQAMLAESQNALRTRTVHSEVLWALSPTNNITEAIRRYGVSDSTSALLVVKIGGSKVTNQQKMEVVVAGTLSSFGVLETLTDWDSMKKYYKLKTDIDVENIVVSTVATKGVM